MSMIGLIGGVSPEATHIYYRLLNDHARARLGGKHSARALFYMLDYGVMIAHYHAEDWDAFKVEVVKGAKALKAGAPPPSQLPPAPPTSRPKPSPMKQACQSFTCSTA